MRLTKAQQELKAATGDVEGYTDQIIAQMQLIGPATALQLIRAYRKKWAEAGAAKRKPKVPLVARVTAADLQRGSEGFPKVGDGR